MAHPDPPDPDSLDKTAVFGFGGGGKELPELPGIQLFERIGGGGMGTVYRGRQLYLDREVAVKFLSENSDMFRRRFQREAKILAELAHPNIVRCYDGNVLNDGMCYMVMEYFPPPNLQDWIDRNGALSLKDATRVAWEIAEALEHALRRDIIHRDVKPANILLKSQPRAAEGESFPFRAMLADLGLARPMISGDSRDMHLSSPGISMGTPSTMAPEQYDGVDVDHRADVYGLGCVLYEALTGQRAFPEKTHSELMAKKLQGLGPDPCDFRKGIPKPVRALVRSMMASKPADRPQTYAELIERLRAAQDGGGGRLGLPVGVIALGAAVIAGAFYLFGGNGQPKDAGPPQTLDAISLARNEGETVALSVGAEGDLGLELFWTLERAEYGAGGPIPVDAEALLPPGDARGATLEVALPRLSADYELGYAVALSRAGEPLGTRKIRVAVTAVDEAPALASGATPGIAPASAVLAPGAEVALEAGRWEDPDLDQTVSYRWSVAGEGAALRELETSEPRNALVLTRELEAPLEARVTLGALSGGRETSAAEATVTLRPALLLRIESGDAVEGGEVSARADFAPPDASPFVVDWSLAVPDGGPRPHGELPFPPGNTETWSFRAPDAEADYALALTARVRHAGIEGGEAARTVQLAVRARNNPPAVVGAAPPVRRVVVAPRWPLPLEPLEWADDGGEPAADWVLEGDAQLVEMRTTPRGRRELHAAGDAGGEVSVLHRAVDPRDADLSSEREVYRVLVDPLRAPLTEARALFDMRTDIAGELTSEQQSTFLPTEGRARWDGDGLRRLLEADPFDAALVGDEPRRLSLRFTPSEPLDLRYRLPMGDWKVALEVANKASDGTPCYLALSAQDGTLLLAIRLREVEVTSAPPGWAPDDAPDGTAAGQPTWTLPEDVSARSAPHFVLELAREGASVHLSARVEEKAGDGAGRSHELEGPGAPLPLDRYGPVDLRLHVRSMISISRWTLAPR